jgi:hypothetical protein
MRSVHHDRLTPPVDIQTGRALYETGDVHFGANPTQGEMGTEGTIIRVEPRPQRRLITRAGKFQETVLAADDAQPDDCCLPGLGERSEPSDDDSKPRTQIGFV